MARVQQMAAPQAPQATQQQIQRLRLAQLMQQQGSSSAPVRTPLEGLGRASQAWAGALDARRLEEELDKEREAAQQDNQGLFEAMQAKPWVDPGSAPGTTRDLNTGKVGWTDPTSPDLPSATDWTGAPTADGSIPPGALPGNGPGNVQGQPWRNAAGQVPATGGLAGALAYNAQTPGVQATQQQLMLQQLLKEPQGAEYKSVPGVGLVRINPDDTTEVAHAAAPKAPAPSDIEKLLMAQGIEKGSPEWNKALANAVNLKTTRAPNQMGALVGEMQAARLEGQRLANVKTREGMEAEKREAAARERAVKRADARMSEKSNIVINSAQSAIDLIESTWGTTGFLGDKLQGVGGTDARSLRGKIDTIKANLAFGELKEMRDASKTGGALGGIAVRELELLGATLASLDQGQKAEEVLANLNTIKESLARWDAARASGGVEAPAGLTGRGDPNQLDPDVENVLKGYGL